MTNHFYLGLRRKNHHLVIIRIVDSQVRLIRHCELSQHLIPDDRRRSEIPIDPHFLLITLIIPDMLSFVPLFLVFVLNAGDKGTR